MYYDKDNNSHCLLIYDEESGDGVIINADGCNYPKYSAFVPHAKTMLEQHELEQSGLKTVKAPITESEKRLLDTILKWMSSGIANLLIRMITVISAIA